MLNESSRRAVIKSKNKQNTIGIDLIVETNKNTYTSQKWFERIYLYCAAIDLH